MTDDSKSTAIKVIIVLAIVSVLANIWKTGFNRYRDENPYAGMPSDFQSSMNEMGLQHAYTGEINTEIQEMLLLYDYIDSADCNVVTSNGELYSVSVTLTGNGWQSNCSALASRIKGVYPDIKVSFYDSNVNIVYSE